MEICCWSSTRVARRVGEEKSSLLDFTFLLDKLHILYIMIYKQYILLTVAKCDDRTLRGG